MNTRIKNVYTKLEQKAIDGLIVSAPANISYLTKFLSRDSYLLISKKDNIYFTDSRYIEEARKMLKGTAVLKRVNGSVFKLIAQACLDLGLKAIGFEERHLPFAEYKSIKEELNKTVDLIPVIGLIEELRQIKEPQEVEKIKKAVQITAAALKFIKDYILPGKKEIEVVAELERFIRYQGASSNAFDIIVASGPNSCYPHHIPTQRKVKDNESVLIDLGVDYLGYKSDLTRIFLLGKINVLVSKVYNIVLKAQEKAIAKIKPAVRISEIDKASRHHIAQRGFGKFFGHNLGHGIGLEVHEEPRISSKDNNIVQPGMVFTIEPAIYLPNKFGIRIEDIVLVTKEGCEVLSDAINK